MFASACCEHVFHPLGLTAIGQGNDESVWCSKYIDGRPIDVARLATHVSQDAEAGSQPANSQVTRFVTAMARINSNGHGLEY